VYTKFIEQWIGLAGYVYVTWSGGSLPAIAVFIIVISSGRGLISRFLAHPIIVFFGEASFALYMIHWLIITIMWEFGMFSLIMHEKLHFMLWMLLLILSSLCYLFLESPCRQMILRYLNREKIKLYL
jgi:peptidoglycan/LPS O-acetylase OafA/YrhL